MAKRPSVYDTFEPTSERKEEEGATVLRLHLPNFEKEQLRIVFVNSSRSLKVQGERPVVGSTNNKWSRFDKTFEVPEGYDAEKIQAKLQQGTLIITMPKKPAADEQTAPLQEKAKETYSVPPTPKDTIPKKQPSKSLPPPPRRQETLSKKDDDKKMSPPSPATPDQKPTTSAEPKVQLQEILSKKEDDKKMSPPSRATTDQKPPTSAEPKVQPQKTLSKKDDDKKMSPPSRATPDQKPPTSAEPKVQPQKTLSKKDDDKKMSPPSRATPDQKPPTSAEPKVQPQKTLSKKDDDKKMSPPSRATPDQKPTTSAEPKVQTPEKHQDGINQKHTHQKLDSNTSSSSTKQADEDHEKTLRNIVEPKADEKKRGVETSGKPITTPESRRAPDKSTAGKQDKWDMDSLRTKAMEMKNAAAAAMKTVRGLSLERKEDKQLLINIGAAALVIISLGAYISFGIRSSRKAKG